MKSIKNLLACGIMLFGLAGLLYLIYSFWNVFVQQQEKYIITGDGAGMGLTVTFFIILFLPVVLCIIVLGYLIAEAHLSKSLLTALKNGFGVISLISGVFAVSALVYFAILPSIQQHEINLLIQNVIFVSPPIILFVLALLAYRKSIRQLIVSRRLIRTEAL